MNTDTMRHSYTIAGMRCENCVQKIAFALRDVVGVTNAAVTLVPPQAHLDMTSHVSTDVLNAAIAGLGAYSLSDAPDHPHRPLQTEAPAAEAPESLYPLFLIVGFIAGTAGLVSLSSGNASPQFFMNNFMAGFFLVFSFFKLLDRHGFADAYRSYDVVARTLPLWGVVYPFVELALGVAYLLRLHPALINTLTLVLMLIGSVGVLQALLDRRTIRCACLGTALKLPMTKVTLVEDLGMAAMAAAMLLMPA